MAPNKTEIMNVIGTVRNKTAILVDDIIDTAGTIVQGAKELTNQGVLEIYACCTHPVFSGPALERLRGSSIKQVVYTNTIPVCPEIEGEKFKVLSVAPLIGEAIMRIHEERSVSELFD